MLAEVMEHFERGHYRPLPVTRFSAEQIVDAFRYMAQRKNIGKIVVSYDAVAERRDDSPAGPFGGASSTSHRWKGPIRPDGTYLITGGLGALGLQLARWLADHGAGHVALLGRSVPGEQAARTIDELRRSGVEVAVLQGDVTDRRSLAAALSAIPDGFPPLRGAFHAAGVLADGLMFDMELAQLDKAMAPKVQGAWNLHEQTQDTPLDWFVLFSSVASVLGSPGQANYAAGNAFLGGLAEYPGMAAQDQTQAQIASRGLDLMPPEKALELLGGMLRTKPTEVAVMDVRWQDVTAGMRRPAPLLKHVVGETDELADAPRGETVNEAFCEELRQSEPERREALLRDYVAGEVCAVMSMDRDDLDMDEPLSTLGLDSLMGMELKIKLESRLGLDLPMGSLFENPTVASLAALAEKSFADDGRTPDGEGPDTHHATGPEDSAWSPLARLASGGSPPSLFCVHPVGGDVRCYFALAQRLRGIRPVWAFRTRGLDGRTEPHASMDQMMADYLRTLQQVQPEGPCYLVGWSTGGIFALELARRLREERQSLGGLILIDTPRPSIFHQAELDDDARFLYDLVNFSNWFAGTEMRVSYEELHRQGSERSLEIVLEEAKRHRVLSDSGSLEHLRRLVRVCKEHVRIVLGYDPKPFDQPVHLIRPEDTGSLMEASGQNLDDDLGWGSILGDRVVTHEVPGNHFSMMTSKNAGPLAELILDILAGAGAVRSTA